MAPFYRRILDDDLLGPCGDLHTLTSLLANLLVLTLSLNNLYPVLHPAISGELC